MKHGTSPRTGSSGGEPGATDWSVRGNGENTTKRRPRLEHPGRNEARPEPPDWIVRGPNPVPRTGASEATERIRQKDARIGASGTEWSKA